MPFLLGSWVTSTDSLPNLVGLYVDEIGLSEEAFEKLALAAAARGLSLGPEEVEEEDDSEEEDGEEEYDEDEYGSEDEDAW